MCILALCGDLLNARKLDAKHDDSELCVYNPTEMLKRYRLLRLSLAFSVSMVLAWSALRASRMQVIATGVLMFLVWAYSAPPFRIKEVPFVDVFWNGTYALCYFIGLREVSRFNTGVRIAMDVIKYAAACWIAQVLHELVDREADANAGYRTLVVAYGSAGIALFFLGITALGIPLGWMIGWSKIYREILPGEVFLFNLWGLGCVLWVIAALLEKCRVPLFDFLVKRLKVVHFLYTFVRLRIFHTYVNDMLWALL